MKDAYLLDAVRTPRGKASKSGALFGTRPVELVAELLRALAERTQIDPRKVDDVVLGCVTQTGPQGSNLGKIAALYAGWGGEVSGATVNRFCASGLDAAGQAVLKIRAGGESLVVAGGAELCSMVPMFADQGPWFADPIVKERTEFVHMGLSADLIATHYGIERGSLDAYALESQTRAARARDEGRFKKAIVPVLHADGTVRLERDELIRGDSTLEKLSALWPAFAELGVEGDARLLTRTTHTAIDHRHTLGTSPALADGACLLLFGDRASADALSLRPRAKIRSVAHASVDPVWMLTGNVPATDRALARAGVSVSDIEIFEVNESFAAVPIHYQRHFGIDPERMNVNGGAIALGHPLGASGAMLLSGLVDELERQDRTLGLATICGGAGVAVAMVVERV